MNSGESRSPRRTTADDHRMEDRRQGRLRLEGASSSAARSYSGCATGWGSSARRRNRRAGSVGARHQRRLLRRADGACGPVLTSMRGRDKRHQPRHDGGAYRAGGAEGLPIRRSTSSGPCSAIRASRPSESGRRGAHLLDAVQSDLLDTRVIRPSVTETTALGAATSQGWR